MTVKPASRQASVEQATPLQSIRWRRRGGRVLTYTVLTLAAIFFVFPFYWMVVSSFKPLTDIFSLPIQLWPARPTLDNYAELFGLISSRELSGMRVRFPLAFVNSLIVAVIYTIGSVLLSTLSGFAFAKLRFRGREVLLWIMLATMMVPHSVGLIPNYLIITRLGWLDTWWPLIIPSLAAPFGIFWMRQYISGVPDEMLEAGQLDGCGPFGLYWRIVVPVIAPGMAALAIFKFMFNWNAFLGPLIYLQTPEKYTLPLLLALLSQAQQGRPIAYNLVFAASFLSVIPILVVFIGAQRYFVAGLTVGSVK